MEAACSTEKKDRETLNIDITDLEIKRAKPGEFLTVEISGKDLNVDIFLNGASEELKGLVSVDLITTGEGEVKADSVKMSLAGKTRSIKDCSIRSDGLASLEECRAAVKSGVIRLEVEIEGLTRKQEFKVKTPPPEETAGINGRSERDAVVAMEKKDVGVSRQPWGGQEESGTSPSGGPQGHRSASGVHTGR